MDFTRTALAVLWLVVILFTPLAVINVEGLQVGSFAARWIVTPHVYSFQGFRKKRKSGSASGSFHAEVCPESRFEHLKF
jgi:hypothetical protein